METIRNLDKLAFMSQDQLNPRSAVEARMDAGLESWYSMHSSLVDERLTQGLSQAAVAQKLGITQPAISVFENSSSLATQIGTLINFAAAIGLEIEFSVKKADYPDLPEL